MQRLLALIYIDVPALRPGTVGAYLLAFGSVGIATALRAPSIRMSGAFSSSRSILRSSSQR